MGLFSPFWMTTDTSNSTERSVLEKISKISNQRKLLQIVLKSPNERFRKQAVRMLEEQSKLGYVAKSSSCEGSRVDAIKKITNQEILTDIVKTEKSGYVRKYAVNKLTNQELLSFLAKNDNDEKVRSVATNKIENYDDLMYLIHEDLSKFEGKSKMIGRPYFALRNILRSKQFSLEMKKKAMNEFERAITIKDNVWSRDIVEILFTEVIPTDLLIIMGFSTTKEASWGHTQDVSWQDTKYNIFYKNEYITCHIKSIYSKGGSVLNDYLGLR